MQSHLRHRKATGIAVVLALACLIISTVGSVAGETTLKIEKINSIRGKICFTVRNIGNETATNLSTTILATGGIFNRINVNQTCQGGCGCNTTLLPNATVTRCASLFGLGLVDMTFSAKAANAPEVSATSTGRILIFFIFIQK